MPSYGERLGGGAVCPLCRGVASSEAEIGHLLEGRSVTCSRVDPLPSSKAEIAQRAREGPSSGAEIVQRARGGCEWAACWASLSPSFPLKEK